MITRTIPRPGKRGGPCANECTHPKCLEKVELAKLPCGICRKPIGYGRAYWEGVRGTQFFYAIVHRDCARKLALDAVPPLPRTIAHRMRR